jgi:hypothetical protein
MPSSDGLAGTIYFMYEFRLLRKNLSIDSFPELYLFYH